MSQVTTDTKVDVLVKGGCQDCPFNDTSGTCNLDRSTNVLEGWPSKCHLIDKEVVINRK